MIFLIFFLFFEFFSLILFFLVFLKFTDNIGRNYDVITDSGATIDYNNVTLNLYDFADKFKPLVFQSNNLSGPNRNLCILKL